MLASRCVMSFSAACCSAEARTASFLLLVPCGPPNRCSQERSKSLRPQRVVAWEAECLGNAGMQVRMWLPSNLPSRVSTIGGRVLKGRCHAVMLLACRWWQTRSGCGRRTTWVVM